MFAVTRAAKVPDPAVKTWSGNAFMGSDWTILDRTGDASNSEAQGYSPSNVFINAAGQLEIKAEKAASNGQSYRSGMIQWTSRSFTFGTLEIRAQVAGGTGPWPAMWLLGQGLQAQNIVTAGDSSTSHWPIVSERADEIDSIEFLTSNRTNVNCQIHADFGSGTVNDGPGSVALGFDASAGMHTYQFVRASGSLTWKVDGTTLGTLTGGNVSSTPAFLILNVAVGGVGGGSITDGTLPQSTLIEYVKVTP